MKAAGGNVVVVGGGLPGLFSALLISEKHPEAQVHLIERDRKLGGLYGSFDDAQGGCFDHGMHLIYESCVEDVDRQLRETMNDADWLFLEGNRKDIAGVYFNGGLQEDSPYIDLRSLPPEVRDKCIAGLFLSMAEENPRARDCSSALDFFLRRFGPAIANDVIAPILQKLWRIDGRQLDPMASRVVLMDRVRLYDSDVVVDLMKSERIRSRIAFPNQMDLPLTYRSRQRGLYPRKFGMSRVIGAIEAKLAARGVRVHLNADISEVVIEDGAVRAVHLKAGGAAMAIEDVRLLHWSIPLFGLAPKLGLRAPTGKFDPPHVQAYVYFLLKRPPKMGSLYYFYCFDAGFHTYRVTNYAGYCPDARRTDGSYPVCVELHFDATVKLGGADLAGLAAKELAQFGVLGQAADIAYAKAEISKAGFPVLTLNNSRMIGELRDHVEGRKIRNLITAGQAPERGIFFLHDVLEHSYNAIQDFQGWQ